MKKQKRNSNGKMFIFYCHLCESNYLHSISKESKEYRLVKCSKCGFQRIKEKIPIIRNGLLQQKRG